MTRASHGRDQCLHKLKRLEMYSYPVDFVHDRDLDRRAPPRTLSGYRGIPYNFWSGCYYNASVRYRGRHIVLHAVQTIQPHPIVLLFRVFFIQCGLPSHRGIESSGVLTTSRSVAEGYTSEHQWNLFYCGGQSK